MTMQKSTLLAKARRLLIKVALIEIALGQERELFEEVTYPASFDENAIRGLRYREMPWPAILKIGYEPGMRPVDSDPYWSEVKNLNRDKLRERFQTLSAQARDVHRAWKKFAE